MYLETLSKWLNSKTRDVSSTNNQRLRSASLHDSRLKITTEFSIRKKANLAIFSSISSKKRVKIQIDYFLPFFVNPK